MYQEVTKHTLRCPNCGGFMCFYIENDMPINECYSCGLRIPVIIETDSRDR